MEPSNNTETEEETVALKKKRARRVSFADNEITSVHIFRRDDSSTTSDDDPPDPVLGFFRDLASESDDEDQLQHLNDEAAGSADRSNSFLQPVGSPSPGGSGSTIAANDDSDEDDFHGPVSAGFIRPERLSDSGASDDVTMDSTAFSLHYRSLARSESGDLKTPTRFGLSPTTQARCRSGSPSGGSFMDLTNPEKVQCQVSAASDDRDSNDMSIVEEHPKSYNFGRLSPRLLAILGEGSKDFAASPLHFKAAGSPKVNDISVDKEPDSRVDLNIPVTSPAHQYQVNHDNTGSPSSAYKSPAKESKDSDTTVPARKQLDFAKTNRGTPIKMDGRNQLNSSDQYELGNNEGQENEGNPKDQGQVSDSKQKSDQVNGSSLHGVTPLSFSSKIQLFMGSPDSSRYSGHITPPSKKYGSLEPDVHVTHGEALSSIRKSISKLNNLETTPNTSTLKEGIDRLKCRLSKYSTGTSVSSEKDCEYKQVEALTAPFEEQPFSLTPKNSIHQGLIYNDNYGNNSYRNISKSSQNEETVANKKNRENLNLISADVSYNDENIKPVEMASSPSQKTHLTKVVDFDLEDSIVEKRKDGVLIVTHDKPFSSPVKPFNRNPSRSVECQNNCHGELKPLDKQNEFVNCGLGQAIEYNMQTVANKLELSDSRNREQTSLPLAVEKVNQFTKSASKSKPVKSPSVRVLVPGTTIQEAPALWPSLALQESPSELIQNNIQDLSHKGKSDGLGCDHDNSYHVVFQVDQSPLPKSGIDALSGQKRKGFEILTDGENIDKIGRIGGSSKVSKSWNGDSQLQLEQISHMGSEREKLGDQMWNDQHILKKLSMSTKQLLSPSVDKLNLRLISKLDDILVQLQKAKKWDILSSEIQSEKLTDSLNIPGQRRVVEMRMLLFNIAYEKAKLQLMHMKRERLLKKLQQLSSGLQETQMMKNSIPCSTKSGSTNIHADDSHTHVSCKKVMEKRQELESLDRKAKSLVEFFYNYCKMEGDRSFANTIKSVRDYLRKRMSYKFIFQNLKLWDIEDFERKDGCFRILLNYCDYITQRFTVNGGLSSIIISNNLNDVNIGKTFPNIDAYSAFVFVLSPHTSKKCPGQIILAQETQVTSSLISNLLYVAEEVQLAQVENINLVHAKFYSGSVHQLDLQLSFTDFFSGKKVQVALDMTCLKWGAYPVDVLPYQIHDPSASGEQKPLPASLVDEIRTAAENEGVGYSRITGLCRCIFKAVQGFTQSK